jgi:hypothetical protein
MHRSQFVQDQKSGRGKAYDEMMKLSIRCLGTIAAVLLGLGFLAIPAAAQQTKTVGGLIVNFGIVPAEVALRADGHRDMHPTNPPPGSQHLLVTLDDEKTGKRIGDADVVVEVSDPAGRVEKKPLLRTQAGGFPDYSELFRFASPGEYTIQVTITSKSGTKPIEARFTVKHSI